MAAHAAAVCLILCGWVAPLAQAQEEPDPTIEIYLESSHRIVVEGVTSVIVLDEEICRAQVGDGYVTLYGLKRGETIAHIMVAERSVTIQVRVVPTPVQRTAPKLREQGSAETGRGTAGSIMTVSSGSGGESQLSGTHRMDWQQTADGRSVVFRAMAQNTPGSTGYPFNVNTATLELSNERSVISLFDFLLDVGGGSKARLPSVTTSNPLMIRGAGVSLKRNSGEYTFYAGARMPGYFLNMAGTGDIAGLNFARDLSPKARLFTTSAFTSFPLDATSGRAKGLFQTAGLAYHFTKNLAFTGSGGISNRGALADVGISYEGWKLSAYASGLLSARNFPLNQMQIYNTGGTSAKTGIAYRWTRAVTTMMSYYRTTSAPVGFSRLTGGSTMISPGVSIALGAGHNLSLVYTLQNSRMGGAGEDQRIARYQASLQNSIGRLMNSFQADYSLRSERGLYDRDRELNIREAILVPTAFGHFSFGATHFRTDPSVLARAQAKLNLLDPAYRQLIETDPVAFSTLALPSEVQQLLNDFQPTSSEVFVDASLNLGSRLTIAPRASVGLRKQATSQSSQTQNFSYNLNYRATQTIQVQSSMSQVFLLSSTIYGRRQTRVLSFGLVKSFSGGPKFLTPLSSRGSIVGYVFRDSDVDGIYQTGEPGLPGIRVQLEDGRSTVTDEHGMYSFTRLDRKAFRVSLKLDQFREAIRVTTPTEATVDLRERPAANVSFGVVNFARVVGMVYNDYRLDGTRQPDAPPVPGVRLELAGPNGRYPLETDGSGNFEVRDVLPGDYELSLAAESLPANYEPADGPIPVRVLPTRTVAVDVPVRALRSLSGRIVLQKAGEKTPTPLAGVRLRVEDQVVVTDSEGRFVFRNLTAGEHVLSVVPYAEPPKELPAPAGRFKMPMEPTNLEGVSIVINNPDLVSYLLPGPEKQMASAVPE
jgi:hypothetical protein